MSVLSVVRVLTDNLKLLYYYIIGNVVGKLDYYSDSATFLLFETSQVCLPLALCDHWHCIVRG